MSDPEAKDPMFDVIEELRSRSVPDGAKARVAASVQRAAIASPWWSLRLPQPKFVVGVALLCGGGALAYHRLNERSAPASHSQATALISPVEEKAHPLDARRLSPEQQTDAQLEKDATQARAPLAPLPRAPLPHAASNSIQKKVPEAEKMDDELAEQIRAYKLALSTAEPTVRATRLRAFKQRYPKSPLLHEVDLNLVAALGEAKAPEQQRAAAQQFLAEHPESARAAEVQTLADGKGTP